MQVRGGISGSSKYLAYLISTDAHWTPPDPLPGPYDESHIKAPRQASSRSKSRVMKQDLPALAAPTTNLSTRQM